MIIMKCEKCGKKTAVFSYKENINGVKKEYNLCADCAKELSKSGEIKTDLGLGFGNFGLDFGFADDFFPAFNTFFGMPGLLSGSGRSTAVLPEEKKCDLCGSTMEDISERGRVGCARCYSVFHDELMPTIFRIHGRAKHVGRGLSKAPTDTAKEAAASSASPIDEKKEELAKAVSTENYELAAKLRDEIKEMEKRG